MTPQAQAFLHRLGALHKRASNGDREAIGQCSTIVRRAAAGDAKAYRVANTLMVIHWTRRNRERFQDAEVFYRRLQGQDPAAWRGLRALVSQKEAGDPEAKSLFSTLKAVHRKYKSSVWSGPGQPRTGHYPMPSYHRPGIAIGAEMPQANVIDTNLLANLLALISWARYSVPETDVAYASPDYESSSESLEGGFFAAPPGSSPLLASVPAALSRNTNPLAATVNPGVTAAAAAALKGRTLASAPVSTSSSVKSAAALATSLQTAKQMKMPAAVITSLQKQYDAALAAERGGRVTLPGYLGGGTISTAPKTNTATLPGFLGGGTFKY